VLDLRLPDMNGFDLLEQVQADERCATCRSWCSPART
jgi:CheY-like chemotaxis protein